MIRMIDLMVAGHPDDPSHTPYGLYDAAAAVGYRRRAARALAEAPVFAEAYWRAYRGESNASAIPTLEQVRQELALQWRRRRVKPGYVIKRGRSFPLPG
jgi:hypothetical protein